MASITSMDGFGSCDDPWLVPSGAECVHGQQPRPPIGPNHPHLRPESPKQSSKIAGNRSVEAALVGVSLDRPPYVETVEPAMLILGVILLLIGIFLHVPILTTIGVILLVIGAILFILGSTGRPVGGRRHYW